VFFMRLVVVLVPLWFGCSTNYNRAALVPHATPRMTSGQPIEGRGQLSIGASSLAHLGDPQPGDTPNQGIEIPGTQLFGNIKGRIGDVFTFGFQYENGLDSGAKKLNKSQPDVDHGNVQGWGVNLDFYIPIEDKWKIGIGVDAMLWNCPYTEYETTQTGGITLRDTGSDIVEQLALSITPSYKLDDDIALFGGLTIRQHPTIDQKGMGNILDDVEVDSGPANYIIAGGIEASLAKDAILLSAIAYYDVSRDPAKYGPGMALMMSLPFGKRHPQQQPPPGMVYPGYGPPPGQPYPQPYPPPGQPYPPQPYPYPQPAPQPYPAPQPAPTEPPPAAPPGG
jgi:hypothetical protein